MFNKISPNIQIRRVEKMEALLNEVLEHKEGVNIRPMLKKLFKYYFGKKWRKDYETDEKGLFPPTLRRGVLTQDAIYDLYTEYGHLVK